MEYFTPSPMYQMLKFLLIGGMSYEKGPLKLSAATRAIFGRSSLLASLTCCAAIWVLTSVRASTGDDAAPSSCQWASPSMP